MLKNKLLSLVLVVLALALTGCAGGGTTDVANMSSSDSKSLRGVGVAYVPTSNAARITRVDNRSLQLDSQAPATWRLRGEWANTVYVDPGVRVFEVNAWWNNVDHYGAVRINVRRGHAYRILFDKPSLSFSYEDMGSNMKPSDMRTWD